MQYKKEKIILFIVNDISFFLSHRIILAKTMIKKGFKVLIAGNYTSDFNLSLYKDLEFINLSTKSVNINPFYNLKTLIQMFTIINRHKPDILHLITLKPIIFGSLISKILKIKKVISSFAGFGITFSYNRSLKNNILKYVILILLKISLNRNNHYFIVQNTRDKKILESLSINRSKIYLFEGSGVDSKKYFYILEPENKIKILMACRLIKEKGVIEYYKSAKYLKKKYPNVEFLLAGKIDRQYPSYISKNEINKWVKENAIIYLGFVSDISKIIQNINIAVLPSFYGEGLPKYLIEAAMCGRPIITTDLPGCKDAVLNGTTGILVEPNNIYSLIQALEKLIINKNLRIKMGKESRIFALNKFEISKIVNKHIDLYFN